MEASRRIRPHPLPCSQALSSPSGPAVGDQDSSALALHWGAVSSAAPELSAVVTEAGARSGWPSEEGAPGGGREGSAQPSSSLPPALLQFWDGVPCGSESSSLSPGGSAPLCSAWLGSAEGVRVGSIRGSCFAVASALLSWARTSGSNKLKLAQDGEGRAKPQAEPWK